MGAARRRWDDDRRGDEHAQPPLAERVLADVLMARGVCAREGRRACSLSKAAWSPCVPSIVITRVCGPPSCCVSFHCWWPAFQRAMSTMLVVLAAASKLCGRPWWKILMSGSSLTPNRLESATRSASSQRTSSHASLTLTSWWFWCSSCAASE